MSLTSEHPIELANAQPVVAISRRNGTESKLLKGDAAAEIVRNVTRLADDS